MQKTFLLSVLLWISPVLGQTTEQKVLEGVQEMMRTQQEVIFSELYNDDRFSSEEKDFLGRLYEIFFQIPVFLKSELEITGEIPTRQQISTGFGISRQSADLLLAVMQTDPRMPSLFQLNTETGEIESLELENIDAFVARRGATVKVRNKLSWGGMFGTPLEIPDEQRIPCPWAITMMHVFWDGRVPRCPGDTEGEEGPGNAWDEPLTVLWNRLGDYRQKHLECRFGELPARCKKCKDWMTGAAERIRPSVESGGR